MKRILFILTIFITSCCNCKELEKKNSMLEKKINSMEFTFDSTLRIINHKIESDAWTIEQLADQDNRTLDLIKLHLKLNH